MLDVSGRACVIRSREFEAGRRASNPCHDASTESRTSCPRRERHGVLNRINSSPLPRWDRISENGREGRPCSDVGWVEWVGMPNY